MYMDRRDCEVTSQELSGAGIPALCYHAGLNDSERITVQDRWVREDRCKVWLAESDLLTLFLSLSLSLSLSLLSLGGLCHHSLWHGH